MNYKKLGFTQRKPTGKKGMWIKGPISPHTVTAIPPIKPFFK